MAALCKSWIYMFCSKIKFYRSKTKDKKNSHRACVFGSPVRVVFCNIIFFNFIFLNSFNFCFLERKKRRRLWKCQLQLFAKWAAFFRALLYFGVLYRNVVGTKLAHTQITHYSELTDCEILIAKYSVSSIYYVYLGK